MTTYLASRRRRNRKTWKFIPRSVVKRVKCLSTSLSVIDTIPSIPAEEQRYQLRNLAVVPERTTCRGAVLPPPALVGLWHLAEPASVGRGCGCIVGRRANVIPKITVMVSNLRLDGETEEPMGSQEAVRKEGWLR